MIVQLRNLKIIKNSKLKIVDINISSSNVYKVDRQRERPVYLPNIWEQVDSIYIDKLNETSYCTSAIITPSDFRLRKFQTYPKRYKKKGDSTTDRNGVSSRGDN